MSASEKIIVYLGPTLSVESAREFLPEGVYKPPAKQGDIVSDVVNELPTYILLIDGQFRQNLSPWHKECCYALQYPGVKGVYGASSMGALRAAELCHLGMIGCGQIFEWYRDGVTEDDSEVAVSYAQLPSGQYKTSTVPLVDIRSGVDYYAREFAGQPIVAAAQKFLEAMRAVHYTERTPALCESAWDNYSGVSFPRMPQKELDAILLLETFRELKSQPDAQKPTPENLSVFFHALYERDRRIRIKGKEIAQQHLDSYAILFNPEFERICWDSANQELALLLCNIMQVQVTMPELERENARFLLRAGIENMSQFETFLETNGWNRHEYDRLIVENARIRKLQHSHTVSKSYRRNTAALLNYLRTHQGFDFWANEATQLEEKISKSGVDDWLGINLETPALVLLNQHFEKEGLELKCWPEEYLLETGFSNLTEMGVALGRIAAGKEFSDV